MNSLYKLIFLIPLLLRVFHQKQGFGKALFHNVNPKIFVSIWFYVLLTGFVLCLIYIAAFLIFKPLFELDGIKDRLISRNGINARNLLIIGPFIIVFNSFLEEYFWRGFIFEALRAKTGLLLSHIISGLAFSLHHVIFIYDWFAPWLVLLVIFGLAGYSIIMNILYIKFKDIFSLWIIHILVDVVQITLGLMILNGKP